MILKEVSREDARLHAMLRVDGRFQWPTDLEMRMKEHHSPREAEAQQMVEERAMIDHLIETFHSNRATDVPPYRSRAEATDHGIEKRRASLS